MPLGVSVSRAGRFAAGVTAGRVGDHHGAPQLPQFVGQVGVLAADRVQVDRLAPLDGVGQLCQQLGQPLVAIGFGRIVRVRRGEVEIGVHEIPAPREGGS